MNENFEMVAKTFQGLEDVLAKELSNLFQTLRKISNQFKEKFKDIDVDAILEALKVKFEKEKITDIDGVKIDFKESWVHLRKSNTEPIIRIVAEAHTMAEAETLVEDIKAVIRSLS